MGKQRDASGPSHREEMRRLLRRTVELVDSCEARNLSNIAHGLDKGANVVSRTRECAIDPLSWSLRYSPWPRAVNMLLDERRSARHPGAASMQLHGCACHCRGCAAGCSARASVLSNLAPDACAQPAAQSPGDARTCVSSCGASLEGS